MALGLLVLALGGGLVWLALRLRAAAPVRAATRARYFDAVLPGLEGARQGRAPTGFPRVAGRMGGLELDLQVVPDSLTFRKLPALWLLVTALEPLPLSQRIHLMTRPRGVEPFSNIARLPVQTALPPGFPADAMLKSEAPLTADEAALLRLHLDLFDDPRVKELVLAPEGLRIVWLADEAERGRYLLFREAELGQEPLAPHALSPLVARLRAIRADILREGMRKCA
jgi:hypothetical protein